MEIKILSSLAKVFPDEITGGLEITRLSCLKNSKVSFQIAVRSETDSCVSVGTDCESAKIYSIGFVPVALAGPENRDDYYIRDAQPGEYPDVLLPFDGKLCLKAGLWSAVWVEIDADNLPAGSDSAVNVLVGEESARIFLDVSSAALGKRRLICTHWFHTDCLMSYYGFEAFSEEYWRVTHAFMRHAAENGINCLLTPLFTPPLDTKEGGERPTVQLVGVKLGKTGEYEFSFDRLGRWIDTALAAGVEYFEMSHLFTQWGAKHAPKIVAETDEGEKRLFGWETDAVGEEYTSFLTALAKPLTEYLKSRRVADRCFFHTSDEPSLDDIEPYAAASEVTRRLFGEFKIIDALSEYEFYEKGLVKTPVVSIEHIDSFFGRASEMWTYYCCLPADKYMPNRFIAMPSLRNRILGFLMYKYDVKGFLHWGYDFYYTQYSLGKIDPYKTTDAGGAFSSGDSFVVYPAPDGTAYSSLRLSVFRDALEDYEALRLLEEKIGRSKTLAVIESDGELLAGNYPHSEKWLLEKREEINKLL